MERIRLTKRIASQERVADAKEPETPIDLGKNRKYHKIDEYHKFQPSLNHWEPDMRHEWKKDQTEREPTNHGIIRMAKVYEAAQNATKLAAMFLGNTADEKQIERQARAFMRMGNKALTASMERWAECNGEECKKEEAPAPAPAEEKPAEAAPAPVEASCTVAEEKKPEEAPAAPAEEAPAPAPAEASCAAAEEKKPEEAPAPAPAVDEEGEVVVEDELIPTEVDFDEPADAPAEADKDIEAVFESDGEEEAPPAAETASAPKKAGIKHLAGQPTLTRVASAKSSDELTGLWDKWGSPDVR